MNVHVSLQGPGTLSRRVYRQLFGAVLDGRLRPGERLPATRELARQLEVSRNTVALAYDQLVAEGILVGRAGAGTFVCTDPVGRMHARHAPGGATLKPGRLWKSIPEPQAILSSPPVYDFRPGSPDAQLFPFTDWRRLVCRQLRLTAFAWDHYCEPSGHVGLRTAIARHIGVSRSVQAHADDVIVTQGAQQALDLIGRVLIEPGDCVAVEEPGYPPARSLFRTHGARVVGVPVDDEGLEVAAIPNAARLIYVTPSHQFPLGVPMSLQRRRALLAWAAKRNAVIVEDDYDSEFRFGGRPLDPLQSMDRDGRVVYVGSFSKVMLPTLRLGFLIAPGSLRGALRTAKQLTDWHGELPTQAALARFIDEGLLARHIRKVGREYATRHARITDAIQRRFGAWLRLVPSAAGLHVTARKAPGVSLNLARVAKHAESWGAVVRTLADYSAETPAQEGIVIGFGSLPTIKVDEGLKRLAKSFRASVMR